MLLGVLSFIVYSEHPVRIGFWFVIYSVMVSIRVGVEWSSYLGYLMFFVYVGALLVMFCMVIRLAPNPVFRVVPFVGLLPLIGGGEVMASGWIRVYGVPVGNIVKGGLYRGLGMYDGFGWGVVLIWLSLILLLRMISVVRMCKWSAGPLVRFRYKKSEFYENFFP